MKRRRDGSLRRSRLPSRGRRGRKRVTRDVADVRICKADASVSPAPDAAPYVVSYALKPSMPVAGPPGARRAAAATLASGRLCGLCDARRFRYSGRLRGPRPHSLLHSIMNLEFLKRAAKSPESETDNARRVAEDMLARI